TKRARQTGAFVCYTNIVGGQDELVFDGGSLVVNPQGKIIARARQFEEDLLTVSLECHCERNEMKRSNLLNSKEIASSPRRPALTTAGQEAWLLAMTQRVTVPPLLEPTAEVYQALVLGTRDYVRKNGFQKVVIGLSGGIDSALVALIARDALGPDNVIGVTMPSKFSSPETQSDTKVLAKNLSIKVIEVPIGEIFEAYLSTLKKEFAQTPFGAAEENIQARIRGNILMAFSNKFGWLVLTTGNKSEIAVGYCTLYGDMSGGFALVKDVPKTKVYDLSRFRNAQEKTPLIPESILDRAPTAELRENQKDQDSLPPYEILDPILKSYVEEHHSFEQVLKESARKKNTADSQDIPRMIKDVIRLVDKSEYKRRQAPPGIKITPRAFGKDWRLPITNGYKEF
ncbi:MAG TPA: NAD+ synthase, partial [Candidatus Omnitrophota bacterium]|nr:NAD+ synthase [Candidatus Omnitrophota bacterium]